MESEQGFYAILQDRSYRYFKEKERILKRFEIYGFNSPSKAIEEYNANENIFCSNYPELFVEVERYKVLVWAFEGIRL